MTKQTGINYNFYYWGPLLFKTKLSSIDLEVCANLCSKKSKFVNETLAGVIKHEHSINAGEYYKIIEPYLDSLRQCFKQWYGKPLNKKITMQVAWVNFMVAGEFNPPHIHTACDFSSILIVKSTEKLKEEYKKYKKRFTKVGGGPGSISFTYGEVQSHSITNKELFPEEGDLFIFPATLVHFVYPFMCKDERITISANFILQ